MKRLTILLLAISVFAALFTLTGCDPEKTGGGGHLQPFDSATGQYK